MMQRMPVKGEAIWPRATAPRERRPDWPERGLQPHCHAGLQPDAAKSC
jgi:hypothetical protein